MMLLVITSLLASFASNAAVRATPIEKVATLLESLRTKVKDEGTEEAKTYNVFACFCKDTMKEKGEAIAQGSASKTTLQASVADEFSKREAADTAIKDATAAIEVIVKKIKDATAARHTAHMKYAEEELDLTGALEGLTAAISALKAAKLSVGFVQLKDLPNTARDALVMAQALLPSLNTRSQEVVAALLQEEPDKKPATTYEFQANDIISTLEGLKTDFKKKKQEIDEAEVASKQTYDQLVVDEESKKKDEETNVEKETGKKTSAQEAMTTASADLTTVSATLLDDQKYLTELAAKCTAKKVLWDKRSQTRADELDALTGAIEIIKGLPTTFVQLNSYRVARTQPSLSFVQTVQAHVPAKLESSDAAPVSTSSRKASASLIGRRATVVSFLKSAAKDLKSADLLDMVAHATEDPFAKVKDMIQALINRLLQQANSEANHKGFCDKQYALAYQNRDATFAKMKELNIKMSAEEARIDKLVEETEILKKESNGLKKAVLEAEKQREKEAAAAATAIRTATEGKKAVEDAIDILDKFYKTAAKNVELLQKNGQQPVAPDAGFDSEYGGDQGGATGVLGMLAVIKADFERTISETTAEEKEAEKVLFDLQTDSAASNAAKAEAIKAKTMAKTDGIQAYNADKEELDKEGVAMGGLMESIAALDKTCKNTGDTYEERVMKREEEIDALKKALCIISAQGSDDAATC